MGTSIVGTAAAAAGRAARLLARDPADAVLSARMAVWVVLVSCLARVLPLPRAHALVARRVRAARSSSPDTPARLARAMDRVLRLDVLSFKRSCWRRALVLHRFLALHGIDSRVTFGVRQVDGQLRGHAWLERDGRPFLEDDAGPYVVTFSLPRPAASGEPCSRG